ncbi:MAG: ribonuclease P protein component 4 [Methanolobus sp.]|jgi:ribonuclease P protein subunit RPR2|nr:ribonuclease P protein component 4 [Methanolobus sp.]
MGRSRTKNKAISKNIAQERIQYLFELAKNELCLNPEKSERYVLLARKIGMRHRVSIPAELKRNFCKQCGSLLVTGQNSRRRIKDGNIIITCLKCGGVKRYPFKRVRSK